MNSPRPSFLAAPLGSPAPDRNPLLSPFKQPVQNLIDSGALPEGYSGPITINCHRGTPRHIDANNRIV